MWRGRRSIWTGSQIGLGDNHLLYCRQRNSWRQGRRDELVLRGKRRRGRSGCSRRWGQRWLRLLTDIDRRAVPIQVHSVLTGSNEGIALCSEGPIGERLIKIVVFSGRDAVRASGVRVEIEVECPHLGRPYR